MEQTWNVYRVTMEVHVPAGDDMERDPAWLALRLEKTIDDNTDVVAHSGTVRYVRSYTD